MLFLFAILGQLADLVTFGMAVNALGIEVEVNPLIRATYAFGGFPAVAGVKISILAILVVAVLALRRANGPTWLEPTMLILSGGMGLFGALTNVTAIARFA